MEYGLDNTMPFGKYKGVEIEEILDADPSYMLWAVENMDLNFDEEVIELVSRI